MFTCFLFPKTFTITTGSSCFEISVSEKHPMLQLSIDEYLNLYMDSKITEIISPESKPFHFSLFMSWIPPPKKLMLKLACCSCVPDHTEESLTQLMLSVKQEVTTDRMDYTV